MVRISGRAALARMPREERAERRAAELKREAEVSDYERRVEAAEEKRRRQEETRREEVKKYEAWKEKAKPVYFDYKLIGYAATPEEAKAMQVSHKRKIREAQLERDPTGLAPKKFKRIPTPTTEPRVEALAGEKIGVMVTREELVVPSAPPPLPEPAYEVKKVEPVIERVKPFKERAYEYYEEKIADPVKELSGKVHRKVVETLDPTLERREAAAEVVKLKEEARLKQVALGYATEETRTIQAQLTGEYALKKFESPSIAKAWVEGRAETLEKEATKRAEKKMELHIVETEPAFKKEYFKKLRGYEKVDIKQFFLAPVIKPLAFIYPKKSEKMEKLQATIGAAFVAGAVTAPFAITEIPKMIVKPRETFGEMKEAFVQDPLRTTAATAGAFVSLKGISRGITKTYGKIKMAKAVKMQKEVKFEISAKVKRDIVYGTDQSKMIKTHLYTKQIRPYVIKYRQEVSQTILPPEARLPDAAPSVPVITKVPYKKYIPITMRSVGHFTRMYETHIKGLGYGRATTFMYPKGETRISTRKVILRETKYSEITGGELKAKDVVVEFWERPTYKAKKVGIDLARPRYKLGKDPSALLAEYTIKAGEVKIPKEWQKTYWMKKPEGLEMRYTEGIMGRIASGKEIHIATTMETRFTFIGDIPKPIQRTTVGVAGLVRQLPLDYSLKGLLKRRQLLPTKEVWKMKGIIQAEKILGKVKTKPMTPFFPKQPRQPFKIITDAKSMLADMFKKKPKPSPEGVGFYPRVFKQEHYPIAPTREGAGMVSPTMATPARVSPTLTPFETFTDISVRALVRKHYAEISPRTMAVSKTAPALAIIQEPSIKLLPQLKPLVKPQVRMKEKPMIKTMVKTRTLLREMPQIKTIVKVKPALLPMVKLKTLVKPVVELEPPVMAAPLTPPVIPVPPIPPTLKRRYVAKPKVKKIKWKERKYLKMPSLIGIHLLGLGYEKHPKQWTGLEARGFPLEEKKKRRKKKVFVQEGLGFVEKMVAKRGRIKTYKFK